MPIKCQGAEHEDEGREQSDQDAFVEHITQCH